MSAGIYVWVLTGLLGDLSAFTEGIPKPKDSRAVLVQLAELPRMLLGRAAARLIRPGMSKYQVESLLGPADNSEGMGLIWESWLYTQYRTYRIDVVFDHRNRVSGPVHFLKERQHQWPFEVGKTNDRGFWPFFSQNKPLPPPVWGLTPQQILEAIQ